MATRQPANKYEDTWGVDDSTIQQAHEDAFEVTVQQVIGKVYLSGNGDMTPHEAAFKLIGSFGDPGTFTFPLASGGTCTVQVDFTTPDGKNVGRNA